MCTLLSLLDRHRRWAIPILVLVVLGFLVGSTQLIFAQTPNPYFNAHPDDDGLEGWDWPAGATVGISIDDPATPVSPDYTASAVVGLDRYFSLALGGQFDLRAGQVVTATHGATLKEHTITSLVVAGVDAEADTVFGTAEPDSLVQVRFHNVTASLEAQAGPDGSWLADFTDIHDAQPGDWGRAEQLDPDGDRTADDWGFPNPHFSANPSNDVLTGLEWPDGATLDISIDDPDTPGSLDYTASAAVGPAPWDPSQTYFELVLGGQFDLRAGTLVTVTHGTTLKYHTITSLVVMGMDAEADTVFGTAAPGSLVWVNFHNVQASLEVQAGQDGSWLADFTGIHDAQPGDWGQAEQFDPDGDRTSDDWGFPNPSFVVDPEGNHVWGFDWQPGGQITIQVDDPASGPGVDHSTTTAADGYGDFNHSLWGFFDLQAGQAVTVTDEVSTKDHTITRLAVTGVDPDANTVSGVAEPGGSLYVATHGDPRYDVWLTADEAGNWTADFTSQVELQPGWSGWVEEFDLDGDRTNDNWRIPNPLFSAHPDDDWLEGWDWPAGATLDISINDPDTPGSPDYTASAAVGPEGYFNLGLGGQFDLRARQVVTVTHGTTVKEHTITSLVVAGVDVEADTVFGTAELDSLVWVNFHNVQASLEVQAGQDGSWQADFTGIHDAQPGDWGRAEQQDLDGDRTADDWRFPNPLFSAHPDDDWLEGWDWPVGATLDISINDPDTPGSPDYTASAAVGPDGYFNLGLGGQFDLRARQVVTATHGTTVKEHTITSLAVAGVDAEADTVFGTAEPGSLVWVNFHNVQASLEVKAEPDGSWLADFTNIYDAQPGDWGRAEQFDLDGDRTADDWGFPNPYIEASPTSNWVHGREWPTGALLTMTISGADGYYTATATMQQAPWNPGDPNDIVADFGLQGYDVQAGDVITVTDEIKSKTLTVSQLEVTDYDLDVDTISGRGTAGVQIQVCANVPNRCITRWVTPGDLGNWTVSYGVSGIPPDDAETFDLQLGSSGWAAEYEADSDRTWADWRVPSYTLHAVPAHPEVHGHDWLAGTFVTLTLDDDNNPANGVLYTAAKNAADDPWCGYPCFDLQGIFNLEVGQYVHMSDGVVTKTVLVSRLTITLVDMETEKVSGVADPGSRVAVNIGSQGDIARYVTTGTNGMWEVDFSIPGDEDFEQNTADIRPGDNGRAIQFNPDGSDDGTLEYWNVPIWVAPDWVPLAIALNGDVDLSQPSSNWEVAPLLLEALFRQQEDGTLVPAAATAYSVSTDNLTYSVTLRDDAFWSDGEPVTAQHYVDGMLRLLDPALNDDFATLLYPIAGAEAYHTGVEPDPATVGITALGDHTLQIRLSQPTAYFKHILASFILLPARLDIIDQYGEVWTSPENLVSNGPYVLREHDGSHLLLQRNDDYHSHAQVTFNWIGFSIIPDMQERTNAYRRGEVDYLYLSHRVYLGEVLDDPSLGPDVNHSTNPSIFYLGLNTLRSPTNNALVRKALASAIDRRAVLDEIMGTPWREAATGVIPSEFLGYQGEEVGYSFDLTQAQTYLSDAGFPEGEGFPELVLVSNEGMEPAVEFIAQQWRDNLRIPVRTEYYDWGAYLEMLRNCREDPGACEYNAYRLGWIVDYYDANNILDDLFHSDNQFTGWDSDAYRDALALSVTEMDLDQRLGYLHEAERILVQDDAAIIPLYFGDRVSLLRGGLNPVFGPSIPYYHLWGFTPYIEANPVDEQVAGYNWPVGSTLTLIIEDPDTPQEPDYIASRTAAPWDEGSGRTRATFDMRGDFDLHAGQVVTLTDGTTSRSHTVARLSIISVDVQASSVSGTANLGSPVSVAACTPMGCAMRHETPREDGSWTANFAVPGEEGDEQDTLSPLDSYSKVEVVASQFDPGGSFTLVPYTISFEIYQHIAAFYELDMVEGWEWPWGTPITLTVDDPATPAIPDYSDTQYVSQEGGRVIFYTYPALDLQPGFTVQMSDGAIIKTLEVAALGIASVDAVRDTVSGSAESGSQLKVSASGVFNVYAERLVTADQDGFWSADFSQPGPQEGEGAVVDIVPEWFSGEVILVDADRDETLVTWDAPYIPYCPRGASIAGTVTQADGQTPLNQADVFFEDYHSGQRLFKLKTGTDGSYGCSLPPDDYRLWATGGGSSREYYPETIYEKAAMVTVAQGSLLTPIDFRLDTPSAIVDYLFFNHQDPLVRDPAVRQAIAFGLDRARLIQENFPASPLLHTYLPADHWAYSPDAALQYSYDPAFAKAILDQAGWIVGGDDVREKDGQRLTLQYVTTPSELRKRVAQVVLQNLADLGIEVWIDTEDPWTKIAKSEYSLAQHAWVLDSNDENSPSPTWFTYQRGSPGNTSQYDHPAADQMLALERMFNTRSQKLPYLRQHQTLVMADLPVLPLFQRIELPDRDGDGVLDDEDACPGESAAGYDADLDGCLDSAAGLRTLIGALYDDGQITNTKTRQKLLDQLAKVEQELAASDYPGASAELDKFIGLVGGEVQKKTITQAAGERLTAYAESLKRWVADRDNLRLGALLEFGQYSEASNELNGFTLAVEQANAAGGVLGGQVLLDRRDSGWDDAALNQEAALDLAQNRQVQAVLGPLASMTTMNILESVIVPNGVVQVSPSNTRPDLALIPDDGLYFRTSDSEIRRGWAAGVQACQANKGKAALIVKTNDALSAKIAAAFTEAFTSACGGVSHIVDLAENAGAALREALGTDPDSAPDLIFVALAYDQYWTTRLAQVGACVLGPDGQRATQRAWSFANRLPDNFVQDVISGVPCGLQIGPDEFKGDASFSPVFELDFGSQAFAAAYLARFGTEPGTFSNTAFDAAALVILAVEEAGSLDPALIKAHLLAVSSGGVPVSDLPQALDLVRSGADIDWQGSYARQVEWLAYPYNHDFQPDGETICPYLVYQLGADGSQAPSKVIGVEELMP